MNYQMFPKTTIGLEAAGGISDQSDSPLQYYQQARVRLIYVATGKPNLIQRGRRSPGIRRNQPHQDQSRLQPGLGLSPVRRTTISVVGYRNISAATSITDRTLPPPASIFRRRSNFCRNLLPESASDMKMTYIPLIAEKPSPRLIAWTTTYTCARG